jgi:hypothetical protein
MSGLWLSAVRDNSGLLPLAGSGVMPVMIVSDMLGCLPSDCRGYLLELRRLNRSALSISRMRWASIRWFSVLCFRARFHSLKPARAPKAAILSRNVRGSPSSVLSVNSVPSPYEYISVLCRPRFEYRLGVNPDAVGGIVEGAIGSPRLGRGSPGENGASPLRTRDTSVWLTILWLPPRAGLYLSRLSKSSFRSFLPKIPLKPLYAARPAPAPSRRFLQVCGCGVSPLNFSYSHDCGESLLSDRGPRLRERTRLGVMVLAPGGGPRLRERARLGAIVLAPGGGLVDGPYMVLVPAVSAGPLLRPSYLES